jgi:hypothetical protein
MSRTILVRLSFGILALAGVWIAHTQNPQAPPQLTLEKIKDDLWVIIGDGGNVAVYPTNEGTILIDDKFERDYTDIMDKVKSVTSQPVKYVLNTTSMATTPEATRRCGALRPRSFPIATPGPIWWSRKCRDWRT